jgi:hypothetical protein
MPSVLFEGVLGPFLGGDRGGERFLIEAGTSPGNVLIPFQLSVVYRPGRLTLQHWLSGGPVSPE